VVGRCEDSDRCVRWLGHTPKIKIPSGVLEAIPTPGMAFLRTLISERECLRSCGNLYTSTCVYRTSWSWNCYLITC
jgi:hypothetical protein